MSQINPPTITVLLQVFRMGLQHDLISREEIMLVVNDIKEAEAPGNIFDEILNSYDETWLFGLLTKKIPYSTSGIHTKVIIGLAYQKFLKQTISTEKFAAVLDDFQYLTFTLQDDLVAETLNYSKMCSDMELAGILAGRWPVLSLYNEFKLTNYENWFQINRRIDEAFQTEQAKINTRNRRYFKARDKKTTTRKLKAKIAVVVLSLFAVFLIAINYQLLAGIKPISIFKIEISEQAVWQNNIIASIFLVRICYDFWKRRGRR